MVRSALHSPRFVALALAALLLAVACGNPGQTRGPGPIFTPAGITPRSDFETSPLP